MHQKSRRRLAADQVCLAPARDPLDFRLHHPLDQAQTVRKHEPTLEEVVRCRVGRRECH